MAIHDCDCKKKHKKTTTLLRLAWLWLTIVADHAMQTSVRACRTVLSPVEDANVFQMLTVAPPPKSSVPKHNERTINYLSFSQTSSSSS